MRNIVLSLIAVMAIVCGCAGTVDVPLADISFTSTGKDKVEMPAYGDKVSVRFSSALEWTAECSAAWLELTPKEGQAGSARISISADANYDGETRTTLVNICSGGLEFPITVTQENYVPTFELVEDASEISFLGGNMYVALLADTDFECSCDADWVAYLNSTGSNKVTSKFFVEPNMGSSSRSAVIKFASATSTLEFTLTQGVEDYGADSWINASFAQRSLAMRFTATWCVYCPYMATAFDAAKEQMPDRLELVSLHGDDSTYEFSGTNTLGRRFKVSGFPTGIVDSRASIPNYQSYTTTALAAMEVAEETQKEYPSTVGIACSSQFNESDLCVSVGLYAKEADAYVMTVLLLEDNIVGNQTGGGAKYVHNDVARQALSSVSGDAADAAAGEMKVYTYSAKLNAGWDVNNLKVLVYVEKPFGSQGRVENSSLAEYGRYGDTYVDNCRVVKIGETAQLELD
ncbi:MAG: Omp28-related outer membrane protein [Bacteroidales bacterium]|nr:Omp28-related outer membrane protein [Bacteroidales bacterium]